MKSSIYTRERRAYKVDLDVFVSGKNNPIGTLKWSGSHVLFIPANNEFPFTADELEDISSLIKSPYIFQNEKGALIPGNGQGIPVSNIQNIQDYYTTYYTGYSNGARESKVDFIRKLKEFIDQEGDKVTFGK